MTLPISFSTPFSHSKRGREETPASDEQTTVQTLALASLNPLQTSPVPSSRQITVIPSAERRSKRVKKDAEIQKSYKQALENGDAEALSKVIPFVDIEVMPDARLNRTTTPFQFALARDFVSVCEVLLQAGAEATKKEKEDLLHQAILAGKASLCNLLFEKEPRLKSKKTSLRAFEFAVLQGQADVGKVLFDQCPSLCNLSNKQLLAPFYTLIKNGHLDFCQLLIEKKPTLLQESFKGLNPLIWAMHHNQEAVLKWLAPLVTEQTRFDVLIETIGAKNVASCDWLLEQFPSLSTKPFGTMSILEYAMHKDASEICQVILDRAPSLLHKEDPSGKTPLYWAIQGRKVEIGQLMLDHITNPAHLELLRKSLFDALDFKQSPFIGPLLHKVQEIGGEEHFTNLLLFAVSRGICTKNLDMLLTLLEAIPGYTFNIDSQTAMAEFVDSLLLTPFSASLADPLIYELIQLKNQLGGEQDASLPILGPEEKGRVTGDALALDADKPPASEYKQIYLLLLAARNLQKYQPVIEAFNNSLPFFENPAAKIAFAISGYILHFENQDGIDKIDHFNTLCDKYFSQAISAENRQEALLAFYRSLFATPALPCFDARITDLETYGESLELDPDFRLKLIGDHETQAGEYFRVFRYLQIDEMARKENKKYKEIKKLILEDFSEENKPIKAAFYANYCTWERMQEYLSSQSASIHITNHIQAKGGFVECFYI